MMKTKRRGVTEREKERKGEREEQSRVEKSGERERERNAERERTAAERAGRVAVQEQGKRGRVGASNQGLLSEEHAVLSRLASRENGREGAC